MTPLAVHSAYEPAYLIGTATQFNLLVGGASNAVVSVAPGATAGIPIISNGASANPGPGTAIVAGGGTGATTFTAHGLIVGEGASAFAAMTPVADSVFVQAAATSDPTTAGTSATADSMLGWAAAGSTPAPMALPSGGTTGCSGASNAATYNNSTHAWGCNTISGGGMTAWSVVKQTAALPMTMSSTNNVTTVSSLTTPAAGTYNLPAAHVAGWRGCLKDGSTNFNTSNATVKGPSGNIYGSTGAVAATTGKVLNMQGQENCFLDDGTDYYVE
jgi:hypothetical protein